MSKQSFKIEIAAGISLIVLTIITWFAFTSFFNDYVTVKAAMEFIKRHRALGENPQFILGIAGNGLPQPFEIIASWREFQVSFAIAIAQIIGLLWLTLCLSVLLHARQTEKSEI